jgi:hypothetical protein
MDSAQSIEIIPVNAIDVVNPRVRNRPFLKRSLPALPTSG